MSKQHFETRKVTRPTKCLMCGYDLQALYEAIRCPECGVRFDHAVPKWTAGRKCWAAIQAIALVIMLIANFVALGPGANGDPIGGAERFIFFWGGVFVCGFISLIWLAFSRRVPATMWMLSALVLGISGLASAFNLVAYFLMILSV